MSPSPRARLRAFLRARIRTRIRTATGAAALLLAGTASQAAVVTVTVVVQNLAPTNSISFVPLHAGFNRGSFDAFDTGGVATSPFNSVAEGGPPMNAHLLLLEDNDAIAVALRLHL